MGIDAERLDREQVLRVRDKFLSDEEKAIVSEDSLEANIIAWTSKEALYKAAMTEGLDFRNDITIKSLPAIDRQMNLPGAPAPVIGKAQVLVADMRNHQDESPATEIRKEVVEMELYSYESEGCCVTIAYSPKCAKFGRKASKA